MKYQIEYCPNPQCVQIHVDQRLIKGTILSTYPYGGGAKEFKKEAVDPKGLFEFSEVIDELNGIEGGVSFGRYHIQILKASDMFKWEEIIPHILNALKTFVARDEEITESAPPKHPTHEELLQLKRDRARMSMLDL